MDSRVETPKEDNLINLKELKFKPSLSTINQLSMNGGGLI